MADSNALSLAQAAMRMQDDVQLAIQALNSAHPNMFDKLKSMQDDVQFATQAFKSAHPEIFDKLKSMQEALATLPALRPVNDAWITPHRPPSPREPSSLRPATPPPSPLDTALQAIQNEINLEDQKEAHLQKRLKRQQELAEKQQRVATLQYKLQAVSQPVRDCRHCKHPLYIHLLDGGLEPCTRSNRFGCGYVPHQMGQKLLVGNLACIKRRNATKQRRKYAARKAREQAGNTAPVL